MGKDEILRLAENVGFTSREIDELSIPIIDFYSLAFDNAKELILSNIQTVKRNHKQKQRLDVAAKATLSGIEECIRTTKNTTLITTSEFS